jgi:SAM-dependent methyltransferase
MSATDDSCYRQDMALVYHRGFGLHAQASAPGILALLEPVRARSGLVLELGCGSGLLTQRLIAAGHRVIATDASPAMLDLARAYAPGAVEIRQLTLPDDPLPEADAVVSVGHAISYLPDEAAIDQALVAIARAVRPGGLFAVDIGDVRYLQVRGASPQLGMAGADWASIDQFSNPEPNRFVRHITTFLPNADGTWRRDDEWHSQLLIDTSRMPGLLAAEGVEVTVGRAFGTERLPVGLRVLIGRRSAESGPRPVNGGEDGVQSRPGG